MRFRPGLLFVPILLLIWVSPVQAIEAIRVTVLPVEPKAGVTQNDAEVITGYLRQAVANAAGTDFQIIDRTSMETALNEKMLSDSGLTDSKSQSDKISGADRTIRGSATRSDGKKFFVSLQTIDAHSGSVLAVQNFSFESLDEIPALIKPISIALLSKPEVPKPAETRDTTTNLPKHSSLIWRSALMPGWGQLHADESKKGGIFLGSAIGLGLYDVILYRSYTKARSDYHDTVGLAGLAVGTAAFPVNYWIFKDKRDRYDAATHRLNRGAFLLGAVYAANLVDIIFFSPSLSASAQIDQGGMYASIRLRF